MLIAWLCIQATFFNFMSFNCFRHSGSHSTNYYVSSWYDLWFHMHSPPFSRFGFSELLVKYMSLPGQVHMFIHVVKLLSVRLHVSCVWWFSHYIRYAQGVDRSESPRSCRSCRSLWGSPAMPVRFVFIRSCPFRDIDHVGRVTFVNLFLESRSQSFTF